VTCSGAGKGRDGLEVADFAVPEEGVVVLLETLERADRWVGLPPGLVICMKG
jgi:hypothetical protein